MATPYDAAPEVPSRVVTVASVLALDSENALPPHVRTAFGVAEVEPRPVLWAGRRAWHCGEVLVRPVADNALAAWSAGVLDGLHVEGMRLAHPVRSSDGRWVVAGAAPPVDHPLI